ncbi:OmpW/AlkL family protein [Sphingobium sp. CCH11-B1]|jgi:outer membrane protein|uniref:OmpW/AlkL family protein n=1 Tax=Sphingobium sp. CCH11-B1 TaxID=1768781 RepID=UPI0009E83934|nr:OmpW family outer membrane protein [Sphingobium sp. CCH11-B1]
MRSFCALFAFTVGCAAGSADAQYLPVKDQKFYVRAGASRIIFDEKANVKVGGQSLEGADGTLSDNTTVVFEIGFHITPHISLAATAGAPPKTTLTAAGTLSGAGTLGKVRYAPGTYTVRYHFGKSGGIQPYLGAGFNWTIVLKNQDGLLQHIRAANTIGPAIAGGVDIPVNQRFGIFLAAMKTWTSTDVRFDLPTPAGLAPGSAHLRMNPAIAYGGVQVRF